MNGEPEFWEPGFFRVFASHLAKHKDYATDLQTHLSRFGISTFVAHKDITPTREWQDEILLALNTTDALVALLTPGFHESSWTDQEVGFVMGRGLLAVAVRLGDKPYGFLGRLQAFQGKGKPGLDVAREMFDAFLRNEQTKSSMARAVVKRFEDSYHFDDARWNMGLLEKIIHWESPFEDRIERAVQDNSQIKGSYGVPVRARQLVRKWTEAE